MLVTADHDFVQMLFASGDTSPSLILIRDVQSLRSAELAGLLADALASGLTDMLSDGVIWDGPGWRDCRAARILGSGRS